MPLNNITYDVDQGEWYPYNADNYTDRARAMMFFNSLNTFVQSSSGSLEFTRVIQVGETNTTNNWPLGPDVTYSDGSPIYRVFYLPSIPQQLQIIVNKSQTGDALDDALYDGYVDDLDNLLESNFTGFRFTNVQYGETDFYDIQHETTVSNIQKFNQTNNLVYAMTLDTLFPDGPIETGFQFDAGILDWNPQYSSESKVGNFIRVLGIPPFGLQVGSYIEVEDTTDISNPVSKGRYQILQIIKDAKNFDCLNVINVDGLPFPADTQVPTSRIKNITGRPRLKIRYRIPTDGGGGGPEEPTLTAYKIYSQFSGDTPLYLAHNSTRSAETHFSNDELFLDGDTTTISVISMAGVKKALPNGLNKVPFGLTTTTSGDSRVRVTPWRKAYRFINRFSPKEMTVKTLSSDETAQATTKIVLNRGPAIPASVTDSPEHTYPLAIPHRPPATQRSNQSNNQNGAIYVAHSEVSRQLLDGSSSVTALEWNTKDWLDPSTDGLVLQESNNPNVISFTANLNDTNNAGGQFTYDYSGLVSCKGTVIPAYSGEILHFESGVGFVANNYSLPSSGGIARTAVFIDITETDEVLRWDGQNYDPVEAWRNTFEKMTITNGSNVIELNNHAVLKTDKNNYVVIMYSGTDEFTINGGDDIQIRMTNKEVITNPQADELPSSSTYGPISYRSLDEEHIDDIRRENNFVPSLSDFTITSDGLLKTGNITINYDGDVPDDTEFRLFIEEEDTDPFSNT